MTEKRGKALRAGTGGEIPLEAAAAAARNTKSALQHNGVQGWLAGASCMY